MTPTIKTNKVRNRLLYIQLPFFFVSYVLSAFFRILGLIPQKDYILGVRDIMKNMIYFKQALGQESLSVQLMSFKKVKKNDTSLKVKGWELYANLNYDYQFHSPIARFFLGPILFGFLLNKAKFFIYFGEAGYFTPYNRKFEFSVLKKLNKRIVLLFAGCDARQREKSIEFFEKLNLDHACNYCHFNCDFNIKKEAHRSASKYADIIFNSIDQAGFLENYIAGESIGLPCIEKEKFSYKFDYKPTESIRVLHAPTQFFFKGTNLVRAAIKRLKEEGYDFIYEEIHGKPNDYVLRALQDSHVVLNQFYAITPGLFGMEAMASGNMVLSSTSNLLNKDMPPNCPIFYTNYSTIYDNLKYILDNPNIMEDYAIAGRHYVEKYFEVGYLRTRIKEVLSTIE